MAEEKLNTGQTEPITPEQSGPAQPGPGDVVVDASKINELMAEQRAAARAEAEQAEAAPSEEAKAPRPRRGGQGAGDFHHRKGPRGFRGGTERAPPRPSPQR